LGLFIVWAAISLLWAEYFSEGVSILQRYILRLVLFLLLIVNEVRTKKNFNGLMNTLAVSGGLLVIVSLFTILKQGYSIGDRLQVLDVNENELGISLILTLPAVFWWSLRPTTKSLQTIKKIIAISYLLASIGLIGLSGSRGSALSLGIMLFMFLLWKPTRFLGIFSLLIIGVSFIITPIIFSTTISRFLEAAGEASLGGREYIWPVAWQLIKEHPILGIGIGNSPYQMIPFLAYAGIIKLGFLSVNEISIHNPILVIWAETGLPGLLLYLGVLVSAIISFSRQFLFSRKIHEDYLMPYFAIVSSMFIGYMAHWIKGGGLESDYSYFLVLALLLIPSQVQIGNSQNS
jgi:O-antigen ligase